MMEMGFGWGIEIPPFGIFYCMCDTESVKIQFITFFSVYMSMVRIEGGDGGIFPSTGLIHPPPSGFSMTSPGGMLFIPPTGDK